jgi:hypothetical protein
MVFYDAWVENRAAFSKAGRKRKRVGDGKEQYRPRIRTARARVEPTTLLGFFHRDHPEFTGGPCVRGNNVPAVRTA